MNKKSRLLKIIGLIILLIIVVFSIYRTNTYLNKERLFIYAKGTDKKAFINATWKMSIKEVERANECELSKNAIPPPDILVGDLNNLLDRDRIDCRESCKKNIGGFDMDVAYDFFDDQLFRVRIYDNVFNKAEIDSLIVASLTPKYGKIERSDENEFSGKFLTDEVEIEYEQFEYDNNQENKRIKRFRLKITYKPLLNEIRSILKQEQNNIF